MTKDYKPESVQMCGRELTLAETLEYRQQKLVEEAASIGMLLRELKDKPWLEKLFQDFAKVRI